MRLRKLILVLFYLGLFINTYSHGSFLVSDSTHFNFTHDSSYFEDFTPVSQIVYVCTGSYAYAYHSNSSCAGLNNCKGEIKYTNENYAAYTLKRVPCCLCWNNVAGRCKDDSNSGGYYGGGGGGGSSGEEEALIYGAVAITAVTLSVLLLSNDMYYSPAFSIDGKSIDGKVMTGFAHNFGFRKTFEKSALEYGAVYSSLNYENSYYINNTSYTYSGKYNYWGFNVSLVHDLTSSFIYKNDQVYGGLALSGFNIDNTPGIGFILGDSYELKDRLKGDFRLFYSQRIFQIQLGVIFNYQKKYIWQRWKEKKQ